MAMADTPILIPLEADHFRLSVDNSIESTHQLELVVVRQCASIVLLVFVLSSESLGRSIVLLASCSSQIWIVSVRLCEEDINYCYSFFNVENLSLFLAREDAAYLHCHWILSLWKFRSSLFELVKKRRSSLREGSRVGGSKTSVVCIVSSTGADWLADFL
ncbi:hypothetical protein Tco_1144348 [Tanacetum coccineum]